MTGAPLRAGFEIDCTAGDAVDLARAVALIFEFGTADNGLEPHHARAGLAVAHSLIRTAELLHADVGAHHSAGRLGDAGGRR